MIYTDLIRPKELNQAEWRQLQTISHQAFSAGLNRSQAEIDILTNWHEPEQYYQSHRDPNSEVGKRLGPNQSFSHSIVALAYDQRDLVGFAYAARNVSGETRAQRLAKRLGTAKNYLWLREIAVRPDYQQRGVAKQLGAMIILGDRTPWRPVTAYIWPDEMPFMSKVLRRRNFEPTGEQKVKMFGENSEPVRQVRMLAPASYQILRRL